MRQKTSFRRVVTWLAIMGYALVVSGLPLPFGGGAGAAATDAGKRLAAKDRSAPFPCMNRPCGCMSAEQCRKHCCCHRPDRISKVAAPASLSLEGSEICRDYESLAATPAERHTRAAEPVHRDPSPDDEPVSSHTIVLKSMLACGGIVSQWLSMGGAPPPPVVVAVAAITPLAEAIVLSDEIFSYERAAPAAPPPRVA